MKLAHVPFGLIKEAAVSEAALPLIRAATYGGLGGLGSHGIKKVLNASHGLPDPSEYGESAVGSALSGAAGGAAIAGLLNLLNRVVK